QMPADDAIELLVREGEYQGIAELEANTRAELRALRAGAIEMLLFEVDPDKLGIRILRSQPLGDLPRAAADVENGAVSDWMTIEDRLLLRPDGLGLRSEVAHHRLIGHLLRLRTARMHPFHRTRSAGKA